MATNPNWFLYKKPNKPVSWPAELKSEFDNRFAPKENIETTPVEVTDTAWDRDTVTKETQTDTPEVQTTEQVENNSEMTPEVRENVTLDPLIASVPIPSEVGVDFLTTQSSSDLANLAINNKIKNSDLLQLQAVDPVKYQEVTANIQKQKAEAQYNMTSEQYKETMDTYLSDIKSVQTPSADERVAKYQEYLNTPQYTSLTNNLTSVVGKVNEINDQLEYLVDDLIEQNGWSSGLLISALSNKSRKNLVRERNGLINEASLLQSQIDQVTTQAQQQYAMYEQSIAEQKAMDMEYIAQKYNIDAQKVQMDFQAIERTISEADSVLSSIGTMKAEEAEFAREMAKEDLKFEREMYKSQVESERDFSYDKALKELDIDSQFAIKDFDTQSKLAILRQEYSLKQQYGDVKVTSVEDEDGNKMAVWYDNKWNIVNIMSPKSWSDLARAEDLTGSVVSDTILSGRIDDLSAIMKPWVEYSCGDRWQCGQWYNDAIWGANGTWVWDTYESKTKFVDETIAEGQKGMGVVFNPWGAFQEYGHIGVLASGLYEKNGKLWYDVISANFKGNEKLTKDFVQANTISMSNGGFIPTNGTPEADMTIGLSEIQIYNNTTFKPQNLEEGSLEYDKWEQFVTKKYEALNDPSTSITDVTYLSAGGKNPTQSQVESLQKYETVINQAGNLTSLIKKKNTWPIANLFNTAYSTDAKAVQAQLQAIIPWLARWVYMEVGVLTDQDIENYKKTLPNLKNTEEVNKAVLAMTLDSLAEWYKVQLAGLAKWWVDVSLYAWAYNSLKLQADQYKKELGIWTNTVDSDAWVGTMLYQSSQWWVSIGWQTSFDINSLLSQ